MDFSLLLSIVMMINSEIVSEWHKFVNDHGKFYANDEEKSSRFYNFWENYQKILTHNRDRAHKTVSYELGVNEFADLTAAEFEKQMLSNFQHSTSRYKRQYDYNTFVGEPGIELPSSVDWRSKGAVTAVKFQYKCGSCWAFAAVGAMEGQLYRKTGKLTSLSEQNLVDCTTDYGNSGCQGGWPYLAYIYMTNRGIASEQSYPYEATNKTDNCRINKAEVVVTGKGYKTIPANDELLLQEAVATVGPISVLFNAKHFHLYKSGVIDEPDCDKSKLNHAAVIVGYGKQLFGKYFWVIKNSFGKSWGEHGYARMARNQNSMCGIASNGKFPKL